MCIGITQILNTLRFQLINKSNTKSKFPLVRLPPCTSLPPMLSSGTSLTRKQHPPWRMELGSQVWCALSASPNVLKSSTWILSACIISCSYIKGYTKAWFCQKSELKRSALCKNFNGVNWENGADINYPEEEDKVDAWEASFELQAKNRKK